MWSRLAAWVMYSQSASPHADTVKIENVWWLESEIKWVQRRQQHVSKSIFLFMKRTLNNNLNAFILLSQVCTVKGNLLNLTNHIYLNKPDKLFFIYCRDHVVPLWELVSCSKSVCFIMQRSLSKISTLKAFILPALIPIIYSDILSWMCFLLVRY